MQNDGDEDEEPVNMTRQAYHSESQPPSSKATRLLTWPRHTFISGTEIITSLETDRHGDCARGKRSSRSSQVHHAKSGRTEAMLKWQTRTESEARNDSRQERKLLIYCLPPARLERAKPRWAPVATGGVLGDGAGGRVRAIDVDVFAVDVLGAGGEGTAVLAAGVALFKTVELESWCEISMLHIHRGHDCCDARHVLAWSLSIRPIVAVDSI